MMHKYIEAKAEDGRLWSKPEEYTGMEGFLASYLSPIPFSPTFTRLLILKTQNFQKLKLPLYLVI